VWAGIMGTRSFPDVATQRTGDPERVARPAAGGRRVSAAFEQGGLLDLLKRALTERALNAEMDHHPAGEDGAGNTHNGYGRKTVMTDTGKMPIGVPRDRQASFDPQLIAKYQRLFPYACGEGRLE